MSRERIELLARANTHGKKFFATGGSHVCSDDFFKAQALLAREEDVGIKIKLKKSLQQKSELHEKGMAILVEKAECFESNNYRNVSTKELDVLLNWYGVEKKAAKKAEKVALWREIREALGCAFLGEFPGIPFFALWVKRNQFLFAEERFEKAGQTAKEPPKTGSFLRGTRYLLA